MSNVKYSVLYYIKYPSRAFKFKKPLKKMKKIIVPKICVAPNTDSVNNYR